jgi:hypothetical protein
MRFMNFVSQSDNCPPMPRSFIDAMARSAAEAQAAGTLLDTGGLAPIARSTAVRVSNGELTVIDGPFAESKEVVGGYGVVEAASQDEAVQRAVWLMNMHREHWPGWEGQVVVRRILGHDEVAGAMEPSPEPSGEAARRAAS